VLGLSFSELLVIAVVALLAVGPQKLPGLLRTLGQWARKLRIMTQEMRAQSGIDDVLRAEGLHGGINELRTLMRGQASLLQQPLYVPPPAYAPPPRPPSTTESAPAPAPPPAEPEPVIEDPYADVEVDASREYPPEGPDAYGAIPDDLLDDVEAPAAEAADGAAAPTGEPPEADTAAPGAAESPEPGPEPDPGPPLAVPLPGEMKAS
jgi:sec-independent protein translocase protein TatB